MDKKMQNIASLLLVFLLLLLIAAGVDIDSNITGFVKQNHTVVILLAIACTSVLIYHLVLLLTKQITEYFYRKTSLRELEEKLTKLSSTEKYTLSLFISDKKVEHLLDPKEPAVAWLESIRIIFNTGKSPDGKKKIFRIAPFAMRALTENPNWLH